MDILAAFLISLFAGEPGVLFLSSIAASNIIPVATIVFCAYTTALLGETFWFFLSRIRRADIWEKKFVQRYSSLITTQAVERHIDSHPFLLLLFGRFIAGLSILAIIYISRRGMSYARFFLYAIIINAIWTPIVVTAGYLAGSGFLFLLEVLKNLEYAFSIAFFGLAIIVLVYSYFSKRIIKWLACREIL